jgi:hypothetical protein
MFRISRWRTIHDSANPYDLRNVLQGHQKDGVWRLEGFSIFLDVWSYFETCGSSRRPRRHQPECQLRTSPQLLQNIPLRSVRSDEYSFS